MISVKEFFKENDISPKRINLNICLNSTGLVDPKIVQMLSILDVYYSMDEISMLSEAISKSQVKEAIINPNETTNKEIAVSYLYNEIINPNKAIEAGATKFHGLSDSFVKQNGVDFTSSMQYKLIKSLIQTSQSTRVDFNLMSSYALNLLNTELNNALYTLDESSLNYNFHTNVKLLDFQSIGERFLYNDISTASFNNIIKAVLPEGELNYNEKSYFNKLEAVLDSKNTPLSKDSLLKTCQFSAALNLLKRFDMKIDKVDYLKEQIPYPIFPFRQAGKNIISNLNRVNTAHVFSILSKTTGNQGISTIATLKETIMQNYKGYNFIEKFADMCEKAMEQSLLRLDDTKHFSPLFNTLLDEATPYLPERKNSIKLDTIGIIKNIRENNKILQSVGN